MSRERFSSEGGFLERFYAGLDRVLGGVLLVLVLAMVFSITAEIVLSALVQPAASSLIRTLGESDTPGSPSGSVEFLEGVVGFVSKASSPVNTASQTLLVWIGILGSALALRERAHLGVDALVRIYPRRARVFLDRFSTVLIAFFSIAVLGVGGGLLSSRAFSLGSKMPGLEIVNRGWFYLVLVITGALSLVYCVHQFFRPRPVVTRKEGGEDSRDS